VRYPDDQLFKNGSPVYIPYQQGDMLLQYFTDDWSLQRR